MPADILVDLGTGMAIIGVMITLFIRVDSKVDRVDSKFDSRFEKMDSKFDSRFEKMDSKFESRFEKMDSKFDAMAQDLVDVKVSVARIEGYLQARDGFMSAGGDRPASKREAEDPPTSYRQAG